MDLMATDSAYYHAVADLYDDMKADDNYHVMADVITQALHHWNAPGRKLLDVGCGTGESSLAFAERGYKVVACDGSTQMLVIARKKLARHGIRILQADMRVLPEKLDGFDVISWIGDVANHLLTDEDLRMAFAGARHALADNGLLVFDVNTAAGFRSRVCGDTIVEREDTVFLWRGQTPDFERESLTRVRIIAFHRTLSGWQRREGDLVERHFSPSTITALLAQAGLVHLAAYGLGRGGLVVGPNEETDMKAVHVARRTDSISHPDRSQLQVRAGLS